MSVSGTAQDGKTTSLQIILLAACDSKLWIEELPLLNISLTNCWSKKLERDKRESIELF